MFTELMPLLRKRRLPLTISLVEGRYDQGYRRSAEGVRHRRQRPHHPIGNHRHAEEPTAEVSPPWKYHPILSKSHLHNANSQL